MSEKTQAPPATAAEGDATAAAPKAKLPMLAMVAVGLAVGGGTGAAVIGPMMAKKMGKVATVPVADSAGAHGAEGGGGEGDASAEGEGAKPAGEAAVHLLENLVLNPANSGGSRFLLLSVAIETGTAAVGAELTARDAELRDIILTALGTRTVEQLTDIAGRDSIKVELQSAIASRFGKGAVKRLYFPQFVVQ
jgi:flagellar FliL protein